jgi:hypothetical protein
MGRYSEYGLQDKKSTRDKGKVGEQAYCPWCEKKVKEGYSMCFVNWVICLPCIREGLQHFNDQNSERIKEDKCFKQWKKDEVKPCFITIGGAFGVCHEELKAGFYYLENKLKVGKNGQLQINF